MKSAGGCASLFGVAFAKELGCTLPLCAFLVWVVSVWTGVNSVGLCIAFCQGAGLRTAIICAHGLWGVNWCEECGVVHHS